MLKELIAINLWLNMVEKQSKEIDTENCRSHQNSHDERRDEINTRPRNNDNDIKHRINEEAPRFDCVHDWFLFDWLGGYGLLFYCTECPTSTRSNLLG